jgi:hypothetical protein
MVALLTDEDFNGRIIRGILLRRPDVNLVRVKDIGLLGAEDPAILEAAAEQSRLLLTHDARTMPVHVRNRLAAGSRLPGVFIVDDLAPIGACIEDIVLILECSAEGEWEDQMHYLPFK